MLWPITLIQSALDLRQGHQKKKKKEGNQGQSAQCRMIFVYGPWLRHLSIHPNSHKDFSFLDYLPGKGGSKNGGSPQDTNQRVSRTTMHCPSLACHSGIAAWAAILCPYDTCFYGVMGLSIFSSLPLIGFCWTEEGLGLEKAILLSYNLPPHSASSLSKQQLCN